MNKCICLKDIVHKLMEMKSEKPGRTLELIRKPDGEANGLMPTRGTTTCSGAPCGHQAGRASGPCGHQVDSLLASYV